MGTVVCLDYPQQCVPGRHGPRGTADREREPDRFGAWVENACLAFAWNAGQQVAYWREEPLEVDAVVDGSWGRLAIEVKTGSFVAADLRKLLEFTRRHPAYRPLLLYDERQLDAARRYGVEAMAWDEFLWRGPQAGRQAGSSGVLTTGH